MFVHATLCCLTSVINRTVKGMFPSVLFLDLLHSTWGCHDCDWENEFPGVCDVYSIMLLRQIVLYQHGTSTQRETCLAVRSISYNSCVHLSCIYAVYLINNTPRDRSIMETRGHDCIARNNCTDSHLKERLTAAASNIGYESHRSKGNWF
jgi:hypothetical protein